MRQGPPILCAHGCPAHIIRFDCGRDSVVRFQRCLVPVDRGPFTAVYGPMTALRAYRVSRLLLNSLATILPAILAFGSSAFFSAERQSRPVHRTAANWGFMDLRSICPFRC